MPLLPRRKNVSEAERQEATVKRNEIIQDLIREVKQNPELTEDEKEERIEVIRNRFEFTSPCRKFFDVIGTGEIFDVRHMADECDIIINKKTPFFKHVYERASQDPEMESLLDLMLFSMGYSEHLSADSPEQKKFWENARRQVSQIAYQFVGEMPEITD